MTKNKKAPRAKISKTKATKATKPTKPAQAATAAVMPAVKGGLLDLPVGSFVRQGDVYVHRIAAVPADVVKAGKSIARDPDGALVFARGEVTGHRHRVVQRATNMLDGGTAGTFMTASETFTLLHEEHDPHTLPAGDYKITIAREYEPGSERNVQD